MPAPPARPQAPLTASGEWTAAALISAIIIFTTWAYSGRASWAPPYFAFFSGLSSLFILATALRERSLRWRAITFIPLILWLALIGASLLNPTYASTPEGWAARSEAIQWLPGTIDRQLTLNAMLPWGSALLLGTILRQIRLGRPATTLLWSILLISGVILAAVGLYFRAIDSDYILGLRRDRYGYHFASFPYRNHWAAYATLLVCLGLGFAFSHLRAWCEQRGRLQAMWPGAVAALLVAITVPLTGSRSGIVLVTICLVAGFALFGWTILRLKPSPRQRDARKTALISLLALLIALGSGIGLASSKLHWAWSKTERQWTNALNGDSHASLRLLFTRDTLRMGADKPVWGWGLGTFMPVFQLYQGDYLKREDGSAIAVVNAAHNDWAQIWAEIGTVGWLLLVTPALWLLWRAWRSPSIRSRWVAFGCTLVAMVALADFPFHNPAVLFLWTVLVATAAPPRPLKSLAPQNHVEATTDLRPSKHRSSTASKQQIL